MAVTINGRTAVHRESQGVLTTTDVCKTPGNDVPVAYTNIAVSDDSAATAGSVLTEGNATCHISSIFSKSTGDEPGSSGGINSGTVSDKAHFVTASNNVFLEGQPAVRQNDLMTSNNRNTAPAPLIQPSAGAPPAEAIIEKQTNTFPNCIDIVVVGGIDQDLQGSIMAAHHDHDDTK